jgi:hypothetical protein
MAPNMNAAGILDKRSNHSVDETLEKLKNTLQAKGITSFTIVDHSGEAERAGLKMRPTKLVIFGNPKASVPEGAASERSGADTNRAAIPYHAGRHFGAFRCAYCCRVDPIPRVQGTRRRLH